MSSREEIVTVDTFKPRWYQQELVNALEVYGRRQLVAIWPRRAGKDVSALNLMLRQAFKRVGVYYYLFPQYAQCRRAIWDSILITGERFLDFIPSALIKKKNETQMKIQLINGSIIQFNGADKISKLLGTNPVGIVYSEYKSVNNPQAYGLMRPILAANGGWVLFISTPEGHNLLYDIYKMAKRSDDWYHTKLTVDDTNHMTEEALAKEREEMSEELFMQEYYCSFEVANTGAYYAKYVAHAYDEDRVGYVPHDASYPVYTAWDLGWHSPSVIVFYQVIGRKICIIDLYHKHNQDLSHYVSLLRSYNVDKGYQYRQHFLPHDAVHHNINDGKTRVQILERLGIKVKVLPKDSFNDGIELVRATFKRMFFDEEKCKLLLSALEKYSRDWDELTKRYINDEKKDWTNDFADVVRYMCISLRYIETNERSPEEFDRRYRELVYGEQSNLPPIFRDWGH